MKGQSINRTEKPWEVAKVSLTKEARELGPRCYYRYHVHGLNHSLGGESFF